MNGQKEIFSASDPFFTIRRQPTTWYNTVNVRMVMEVLAPCMQHGDSADFGTEMFGIGGDREERFMCSAKKNVINHILVLKGDLGDGCRNREDNVEIRHRQ